MQSNRPKTTTSVIVVDRSFRAASGQRACRVNSLCLGSFPGLYNVTSNVYGLEGSSVSIYAERTARIPTQIQWEVETSLSEINLAVVQRYTVTRINSVILKNISVGFNLTRYRYILPGGFKSAWVTLRIGGRQ